MAVALTQEQTTVLAKLVHKMDELGFTARFLPPVSTGPLVSVYRFLPTGRTRVSSIEGLSDDLSVYLGRGDVLAKKMPGEGAVAIFVPNEVREKVNFIDTVSNVWRAYAEGSKIPLNFGVDHLGNPFVADLTELPHLLVAGSTGTGKSTWLSSALAACIYTLNSKCVNFILSDTKAVEFGRFIGAPHLLYPPATTVWDTLDHMEWLVDEVMRRLKKIGAANCRNIHEFKEKTSEQIPFIVLCIDELADILGDRSKDGGKGPSVGKIAEGFLASIVQKSRASGVYCIAATQRPSVKLVEGNIKSNFPARLSFRLPSGFDSVTVLGTGGAEHLLSRGDMLYKSPFDSALHRLHAPIARLEDIEAAVEAAIQKEANDV